MNYLMLMAGLSSIVDSLNSGLEVPSGVYTDPQVVNDDQGKAICAVFTSKKDGKKYALPPKTVRDIAASKVEGCKEHDDGFEITDASKFWFSDPYVVDGESVRTIAPGGVNARSGKTS